jgi:integrating conjugative element membrane protein (TIGR03747 family)
MGHPEAKRNDRVPPKKKQRGIVGSALHFIWLTTCISLLAWFLIGAGFAVYQFIQGKDKAQYQISRIIEANTRILKNENHFLIGDAYLVFESAEKTVLNVVLIKTHTADAWAWITQTAQHANVLLNDQAPELEAIKNKAIHSWSRVFYSVLTLFLGSAFIVGMRLFIFLLSLPLFLLGMGLGCVDGLVQRDIRKFQAARESTYVFHRIKRTWKPCFFISLFLYFVWPFFVPPLWFLMPMALALGFMVQLSVRSFKKYM